MTNSTQKRMIVLKTEDSPYFEEAHLILKEESTEDEGMVSEACRIISRAQARRVYPSYTTGRRPPASRMAWFFMGIATTLVTGCVSGLIIHLLF